MRHPTTFMTLCVCATLIACAALLSHAGPLDPPAGVVTPTYKTLHQAEPSTPVHPDFLASDATAVFVIREPGAYHLVADVVGEAMKDGLRIETSDVTLDLRGFNLRGVDRSGSGITLLPAPGEDERRFGIIVKGHGRVFGWGENGIDLAFAARSRVEDVVLSNNSISGLVMDDGATVLRVAAESNGLDGIRCADDAHLTDCTANANAKGAGIVVRDRAHISGCSASLNNDVGISAQNGATIERCVCYNNASGITVLEEATVIACATHRNASFGLSADRALFAKDCHARENGVAGFFVVRDATYTDCRAFQNGSDGFRVQNGDAHFTHCTASKHPVNGFQIGEGSSITGCLAEGNDFPGIAAFDDCTIIGNTLVDHRRIGGGNAAIGIVGDRCRIEGNHIATADQGVRIVGTNCVVVKNTVSDCPAPYANIDPGNRVGTISTNPAGAGAWDNFQEF